MSLFLEEEVCKECRLAQFHKCCNKFCKCSENHEDSIDHVLGKCVYLIKKEI